MNDFVMQMNEVHLRASGWVQCGVPMLATMIEEPGHPTGHLEIAFKTGDEQC